MAFKISFLLLQIVLCPWIPDMISYQQGIIKTKRENIPKSGDDPYHSTCFGVPTWNFYLTTSTYLCNSYSVVDWLCCVSFLFVNDQRIRTVDVLLHNSYDICYGAIAVEKSDDRRIR